MKDWKSDLLEIKIKAPLKNEVQLPEKSSANKTISTKAASIKPIETEKKILGLIRHIESLTASLLKIAPFPLVKGNSKQIKQYQREIKILKEEFTSLSYKFKPSLVNGTKVLNTNALIIEMKNELQERDTRYQKLLIAEQQLEHERQNNERELRLEKERIKNKEEDKEEERKQKEQAKNKELLSEKALSIIKKYDVSRCASCKYGDIVIPCDKCLGTRRLSQARKGFITERFHCSNLKPNCQFCGGLGVFSKQKEGLTYECDDCTNGKKIKSCKICRGTGLSIKNDGAIPMKEVIESLESNKDLTAEIQKIISNNIKSLL